MIDTSKLWAVMLRCPDGTWSLKGTESSLRWERNLHTITYTDAPTQAEAQRIADDLNKNAPRGTRAWAIPYDERYYP